MRKPSASMIVALVALFTALSGVGVAANGGNFILGHSNSATLSTSLTAPVAGGKALQLTNTNTSNPASTALGLNVAPNHAPFAVNSAVKVANLNADTLDGIDSSGFVQGRAIFLGSRIVFVPATTKRLLTIPGLGHLDAACHSFGVAVYYGNDTGGNVDLWSDESNSHFQGGVVQSSTSEFPFISAAPGGANTGVTLSIGVGNDPNPRRTALLHVFAFQESTGAPCGFQVQGTLWTSLPAGA